MRLLVERWMPGYTIPPMAHPSFDEAYRQALAHLAAGRHDAAHQALSAFVGAAATERAVARGFLELWQHSLGQPELVGEVKRIMSGFMADPELVVSACQVLIRDAERLPLDQPPPRDGAAHAAVALAQRGLERLPQAYRDKQEILASLQVCLGNALRLAHLYERAAKALSSAVEKQPDRGSIWFDLGILHKQRRAFAAGVEANRNARALLGGQRALLWNLAICATGVGDGPTAVDAWSALGLPASVTARGMPQGPPMPPVQVRVATVSAGHMGPTSMPERAVGFELVWVSPLSPCHGVVQTPTYRQGSVDYGDVVLWDAVPVGTASFDGRRVPRFPLLAVLCKGDEHRFRFVALQRTENAIGGLEGPLPGGGQLFVHRERVEGISLQLSSRRNPLVPSIKSRLVYGKVVLPGGTDLGVFRRAFDAQVAASDVELVMPELHEALGDTAAAGKAHILWRGLERTVEKTSIQ